MFLAVARTSRSSRRAPPGTNIGERNYPSLFGKGTSMLTASECRKVAAECLAVAERMPSSDDRRRLTAMARIWLMLAQQATEEGNRAGGLASTPRHLLH